jgi:hypothetical protein
MKLTREGVNSCSKDKLLIQNKALNRVVFYYKTYEELFGQEQASALLVNARESVDIVLDALEKELAYNAVKFLGFKSNRVISTA